MSAESPKEGKKKASTGKKALYGIGGLFLLMVLARACAGTGERDRSTRPSSPGASQASRAPAVQITATALLKAYDDNEVSADSQYKGQELIVEGTVDDIKKTVFDSMYVALASGKEMEFRRVQCIFSDKHNDELTRLSKGQRLKIQGECTGLMGNVHLENCMIVP